MKKLILTSAFIFIAIFLSAQFTVKGITLGEKSTYDKFYTTVGGIYGEIYLHKLNDNTVSSIFFTSTDKNGKPDYHSIDEVLDFKYRVEQYYKIHHEVSADGPLLWIFMYHSSDWMYSSQIGFFRRNDYDDVFTLYFNLFDTKAGEIYQKQNPKIPDKSDSDF